MYIYIRIASAENSNHKQKTKSLSSSELTDLLSPKPLDEINKDIISDKGIYIYAYTYINIHIVVHICILQSDLKSIILYWEQRLLCVSVCVCVCVRARVCICVVF